MKSPPAPKHLEASGRALWAAVAGHYVLEPHHLRILQAAAECADRAEAARVAVDRDGLMVDSPRYGSKSHPLLTVERDQRTLMARLVRDLGLDLEDVKPSRPPSRFDG